MPARKSGFLLFISILSSKISIAAKRAERHPRNGKNANRVAKNGLIKQFCDFPFSVTIYIWFLRRRRHE